MNDHERIDQQDERLRKVENITFNGLQKVCAKMEKWLDERAPNLMTREEHEKLDDKRDRDTTEHNRKIGRKKDRRLVALGIAIPALTVIVLKVWESV